MFWANILYKCHGFIPGLKTSGFQSQFLLGSDLYSWRRHVCPNLNDNYRRQSFLNFRIEYSDSIEYSRKKKEERVTGVFSRCGIWNTAPRLAQSLCIAIKYKMHQSYVGLKKKFFLNNEGRSQEYFASIKYGTMLINVQNLIASQYSKKCIIFTLDLEKLLLE